MRQRASIPLMADDGLTDEEIAHELEVGWATVSGARSAFFRDRAGCVMLARMRKTEAKWVERILQWKASGISAEQFAQGEGYRPSTLLWYSTRLKHLGLLENAGLREAESAARSERDSASRSRVSGSGRVQRGGGAMAAPSTLTGPTIPIAKVVRRSEAPQVAATAPRGTGVVVEIGPARIEVGAGFDAEILQDVVRALLGAA
jgi:hypothetical protein